ncbi:MAG: HAMP domain-containing histidine kinase [Fibrobacter sp.]|nr:HAMP domain-containing histidine kinase [Fibrobacter sp.]
MRKVSFNKFKTYVIKHQTAIKERLVFICIFLALAIPMTIFMVRSYEQSNALEEKKLEETISKAYSDLNDIFANDINRENNRPYKDYGILKSISVIGGDAELVSEFVAFPDTSGPFCAYNPQLNYCQKGLVGHFQISHNGKLLTPFYPDSDTDVGRSFWEIISQDQPRERKATHDLIQNLLNQLNIKNKAATTKIPLLSDTTENIDEFTENYVKDSSKHVEIKIPSRIEQTSEAEAFTYWAENARIDNEVYPYEDDGYETDTSQAEITHMESILQQQMLTGGTKIPVTVENMQVKATDVYLVFYRQIFIGKLAVVQGFVVDKVVYLNYMTQELHDMYARLPFAIELWEGGSPVLNLGFKSSRYEMQASRKMMAPYERFTFKMYTDSTENSSNITVILAGILLLIVVAICMVTIYRFMQSKVALAAKRQDFVSAITHELKTPLTAIKMYAELLQNSWVASEEKKQKYYTQIASEADRLSRLIQNVLNLSKLDGNRWNVQLRKERPKAVLDDFIATYSRNVEKQGFELTVSSDTDASNVSLLIDRDAIMQILMNLVDNSLKFSKNAEYKMINIELAIKGTDMYLAVRDYGPGIPPSEMKKVFQEFYRVENEMTRQTSGTGIGLSMVKKLCTLCNMKIEIENANPGLRTKIHFPSLSI